ncbi:MAG: SMP-30/gluconolactonase/LRE family protein [Pseudohongiellaceae bacterium]|jgi:gluconolactonase
MIPTLLHGALRPTLLCAVLLGSGSLLAQSLPGERPTRITGLPGIVAEGASWEVVWADFETADGIVGTADGGILFAQEQTDSLRKLDASGKEFVLADDLPGPGAISVDAEGRMFAVLRTCTDPGKPFFQSCAKLTRVVQLAPVYRELATSFADGRPLGRLNDLIADGKGGAYFTVGGAFHVSATGKVSVVEDQNLRSNGILLSRDGRTLYVTNDTVVLAFDVAEDGSTSNRRDFVALDGDNGGDGMAIDAEGRLFITGNKGVHVASAAGDYLGLIPTPRRPITLAFAGPEGNLLYAPSMGAVGPDGRAWATPEGVRNTAMTIYRLTTATKRFEGRPK